VCVCVCVCAHIHTYIHIMHVVYYIKISAAWSRAKLGITIIHVIDQIINPSSVGLIFLF